MRYQTFTDLLYFTLVLVVAATISVSMANTDQGYPLVTAGIVVTEPGKTDELPEPAEEVWQLARAR